MEFFKISREDVQSLKNGTVLLRRAAMERFVGTVIGWKV
jgi:hypothetical protein